MARRSTILAVRPWRPAAIRWLCTAASAEESTSPSPSPAPVVEWKPLYRRISALAGAPEGSVADVLDQWVMERHKVHAPDLMRHVRELRKYRRHKHALEMMDWMEGSGLVMPNGSHAIRLDLISKIEGIASAEQYFSSLPEPAKHYGTYGALLSCYCKENMVDKATALHDKMKELNFAYNNLAYNNLMSLYFRLGQLEKVLSLFEEMKTTNIVQDNCTHRILMKCYASMNDMDSVDKLVQEMEASKGALDWFTYCHLADIYNSAGLYEKAETSLRKAELVMESRDLSPLRFLISLYGGAGNLEEVKRVWNLLKARIPRPHNANPRPTNLSYLVMLQALKKLDDMYALKKCFQEWESGCLKYDIRLVNTMISAYLSKDKLEEAELLQETAAKKGAQSDFQTFVLFIDYYLKSSDLELARKCSVAATSMVKKGRVMSPEKDDQGS